MTPMLAMPCEVHTRDRSGSFPEDLSGAPDLALEDIGCRG